MTGPNDATGNTVHNSLQETFREVWRSTDGIKGTLNIVSGAEVVPNLRFWLDPEGEQEVTCRAERGGGFTIQAQVTRPGRWLGLHVMLGESDLSNLGIIGFFARSHAARAHSWRACLRSHQRDGFVDHFFDKRGVSCAAPSTHLDVMEIDRQSRLPLGAVGREFILFFHVESFELALRDLRLFCA